MPNCCSICAREFAQKASLLQHLADKHGQARQTKNNRFDLRAQLVPSAPTGLQGMGAWVARLEFGGTKSFGYFTCGNCSACWLSAHSFRDQFRQQCKTCRAWSQPRYLWVNYYENDKDERGEEERVTKPHHADKCEACKANACTRSRDHYF